MSEAAAPSGARLPVTPSLLPRLLPIRACVPAALALGLGIAAILAVTPAPAAAQEASPHVDMLDLPFRVSEMRGPGSEVALAVATSGAVPRQRPRAANADPKAAPAAETQEADLVVVWGEAGGAALILADGRVRAIPLAPEAVEGFAAAETPRGAVPGSRRAAAGALTAYLSGPVRSATGASGQAAGLTIRERQPVGVSAEPRPVPIATATVTPGAERLFAARRPRILSLDGRPHVLAVLAEDKAGTGRRASALAAFAKDAAGRWALAALSPFQGGEGFEGAPLAPAAIADFSGTGRPQIASLRAPDGAGMLQLYAFEGGALTLLREAPGYAGPSDAADLAAALPPSGSGAAELALPVSDRTALAFLTLKDGIRERARVALPAPAASGVAALGRGEGARILVGLADGRVAVVGPAGAAP